MFLKSHTELPVGFAMVCVGLARCPASTLVEVASDVQRRGRRMLVETGLGQFARGFDAPPQIEVGQHRSTDRIASLPFRLWAERGGRTLWELECSLDAAWLGPDRTYLALSGQYELPFAVLEGTVDRALVHRVAETGAQRFVEATAQRLTG